MYFIAYKGNTQPVVSIAGARSIASRTGLYGGSSLPLYAKDETSPWQDRWDFKKDGYPAYAKVEVYVRGENRVTAEVASWEEYGASKVGVSSSPWKQYPTAMLAKCAEMKALRKAFPESFSGTYSIDEMEGTVIKASESQTSVTVENPKDIVISGDKPNQAVVVESTVVESVDWGDMKALMTSLNGKRDKLFLLEMAYEKGYIQLSDVQVKAVRALAGKPIAKRDELANKAFAKADQSFADAIIKCAIEEIEHMLNENGLDIEVVPDKVATFAPEITDVEIL
jgi:hypothetical protein